jgi:heptosyltransferase III
LPTQTVTVLDCAPLLAVARELQACAAYVGNDSGISHLAAAIGVPSVVLFGPTNPVVWRPLGPRVVILKQSDAPCCADISPEEVFHAVLVLLVPGDLHF